jgi:hypothetical protein
MWSVCCAQKTPSDPEPFKGAGAWWAFSFGQSERMSNNWKNDVPNISVVALPSSLDVATNAEIQPSARVMRERVSAFRDTFDALVKSHGQLQLQAWFKLEHQPRGYHWIPWEMVSPGEWGAQELLDACSRAEADFASLREYWISRIRDRQPDLSQKQLAHMEKSNKSLNLALRLVRPFPKNDSFWSLHYPEQIIALNCEYRILKPMIDFFQ